MPTVSLIFLVLVFMAAGFPPFTGFWPKLMLLSESVKNEAFWGTAGIILNSFLSLIALGRAYAFGFWRPLQPAGQTPLSQAQAKLTGPRKLQYIPVLLLVVLIGLIGFMPAYLFDFSEAGAKTLLNNTAYIEAVFGGAS